MKPQFRSKQEVMINAPLEKVWTFNMNLSKIEDYHPRVFKVDLISGKTMREAGASYRCHLKGGKHTCVERDVEIVPMEKIVTILPEDTFGISRILTDYMVETSFSWISEKETRMVISHYYSTKTLRAKFLNLMGKMKIARETQETLNAIKKTIESEQAS